MTRQRRVQEDVSCETPRVATDMYDSANVSDVLAFCVILCD